MAIHQYHIKKIIFSHFHIYGNLTKTYKHKKSFLHFHIYVNPTSGGCDDWQPGRLLRAGKAERDWDLAQTMVLQTCPRIL